MHRRACHVQTSVVRGRTIVEPCARNWMVRKPCSSVATQCLAPLAHAANGDPVICSTWSLWISRPGVLQRSRFARNAAHAVWMTSRHSLPCPPSLWMHARKTLRCPLRQPRPFAESTRKRLSSMGPRGQIPAVAISPTDTWRCADLRNVLCNYAQTNTKFHSSAELACPTHTSELDARCRYPKETQPQFVRSHTRLAGRDLLGTHLGPGGSRIPSQRTRLAKPATL